MLTDVEIIKTIERLRRAQPRNADVLAICDELQSRVIAHRAATSPTPQAEPAPDRKAYMREYMRKKRAERKP